MAQKILSGRATDPTLQGDVVEAKVDQIVLARAPARALHLAREIGLKRAGVEVAIAYDGVCVTELGQGDALDAADFVGHNVLVGRPGVGFPAMTHLERFASPGRLCVTDEPRLAGVGGIGMLPIVVPAPMLAEALTHGRVWLRPPRSVQVLLSGNFRPFVGARDAAIELVRKGLGDVVARVEAAHRAPVVLEFAGPSVRRLSVSERAILASIAPSIGAAAALFVSDERTEVFLRDQRRSKAHRALVPDAGAPCEDVVSLDFGTVDPMLLDETGTPRSVRDLAGKPVSQVILGGDGGTTLRDLFAVAMLLKSKRVPSRLEFLLAVPSRQVLEVLGAGGALTDLIATGARLVEPDARLATGSMYPPVAGGLSVRTVDREPRLGPHAGHIVASAETVAAVVATGEITDPRTFKRPVRVTVPRVLPTDDVLVVRDRKGTEAAPKKEPPDLALAPAWKAAQALEVVDAATFEGGAKAVVAVAASVDETRALAARVLEGRAAGLRAVLAAAMPSPLATIFGAAGVLPLEGLAPKGSAAKGKAVQVPAPAAFADGPQTLAMGSGKVQATARLTATERGWLTAGAIRAKTKA
ncbi:MAG: 3-isopropylmalate dehydratase [Myxococcales bacterium]|nr:3-isopropylmalate dehydratase [Myxococcales bacterium]